MCLQIESFKFNYISQKRVSYKSIFEATQLVTPQTLFYINLLHDTRILYM